VKLKAERRLTILTMSTSALRTYAKVLVEGESMAPTYQPGDWLMARWGGYRLRNRWFHLFFQRGSRARLGDVVIVERDEQPGIFYIKRITDIRLDSYEIFVSSDNPAGTDSHQWGWLSGSTIRAKVISRVKRGKRKG